METKKYSKCSKCGKIKFNNEFNKRKTARDGCSSQCKECANESRRKRREKNPEHLAMWRKNNRELLRVADREYRKNNPEKRRASAKKRYKKDKEIPKYRINHNLSGEIWKSLKGNKNGRHCEALVGYTLYDLMTHLGGLFKEEMTWDNYGKWHVDHIRPISSFNFSFYEDEEFKKCWALNNLQPLWAEENLKKGHRLGRIF